MHEKVSAFCFVICACEGECIFVLKPLKKIKKSHYCMYHPFRPMCVFGGWGGGLGGCLHVEGGKGCMDEGVAVKG